MNFYLMILGIFIITFIVSLFWTWAIFNARKKIKRRHDNKNDNERKPFIILFFVIYFLLSIGSFIVFLI